MTWRSLNLAKMCFTASASNGKRCFQLSNSRNESRGVAKSNVMIWLCSSSPRLPCSALRLSAPLHHCKDKVGREPFCGDAHLPHSLSAQLAPSLLLSFTSEMFLSLLFFFSPPAISLSYVCHRQVMKIRAHDFSRGKYSFLLWHFDLLCLQVEELFC